MNALYHAHSGIRYLVLLAAVVAIIVLGYGLATGRRLRATRAATASFTGLLDLQVLLGLALVMGGMLTDRATGHLIMMVLALVVAHAASVMAGKATDDRRELTVRLIGIVLSLALIAAGIMAIGRSVLGSLPPTVG
jgi:hypothetical protein